MKQISTKETSRFSAVSLKLAGLLLCLILGAGAWAQPAEGKNGSVPMSELFIAPSENFIVSEAEGTSGGNASLGIGVNWISALWQKKEAPCYDSSFKGFLASREGVCIPRYTEPVVWEENPRYTVQDNGCGVQIFRTKIKNGDSFGALFRSWLDKDEQKDALKALSSVFKLNRLRLSKVFSVEVDTKDGKVSRLLYDINEESRLVVCREQSGFSASVNVYPYETKVVRVSGEVKTSLFDAIAETGEGAELTMQLADVFSHQVDFVNDVHPGDSFEIIVEKKFLEGTFRAYGDIVAARYKNNGEVYEAFRFRDDDGNAHYYAADGSSLETQFLKAPLNFTRISSSYTKNRRHPVLGKVRPHKGVDYAAPRGTPVKALGEGVVTFVGWKGGYGKSVSIRHKGGIDTYYAHLSRYAKNLKKGDRVEQGQIIAFVGSTGIATGPHLHFEVLKNGKLINPLKLAGNRASSIPIEKKEMFESLTQRARLMLDGEVILAER